MHATRDSRNLGSLRNTLDLVLTNNDDSLVEKVIVRPSAFDSNHHPLI